MAAALVPIRLGLTAGDRYTLWAPRWRDDGDDWEGFLGRDEDLYVFESVADLAAFVRTDSDNDLADHPSWPRLAQANAHKLAPGSGGDADLVGVEELLADKPGEESVATLASTFAVASSIGSVCELPAVTRFFNGNPNLGWVSGGVDQFSGRAGRKRWDEIGEIIARGWDGVLAAIEGVVTTPAVDERAAAAASAELDEPFEDAEDDISEGAADDGDLDSDDDEVTASSALAAPAALGGDREFWEHVGIDPIRVMASGGTFYTLRCYYGERPIFLGRNGRISVFPSERTLARYLADEHDHDLSDLSTYDDIRTAATDGSLRCDVTTENNYVLTGLVDDISDGPDAIDQDQLALAVEFVRDVGTYSEDDTVKTLLAGDTAIGRLVGSVLEPGSAPRPAGPHAKAVAEWEELERFVESRLRRE